MATIYSPWTPADDPERILLAGKEFEAPMPESPEMEPADNAAETNMMTEALSIINEQSQLIKSLTAQLTGSPGQVNE